MDVFLTMKARDIPTNLMAICNHFNRKEHWGEIAKYMVITEEKIKVSMEIILSAQNFEQKEVQLCF